MAGPALVALAHGSRDPRSAATINALVGEIRAMRPDLKVERAFLDLAKPSLETAVAMGPESKRPVPLVIQAATV